MMFFRGAGGLGRSFSDGFGYMHNGCGFFMIGIGLLVIALIIVAVVVLVRKSNRNRPVYQNNENIDLLNARFVKGEITEEEYIRMKKVLSAK